MATISDAVGLSRVANVVGYKLESGDFSTVPPYLPQRVVILGKENVVGTVSRDPYLATSEDQVGQVSGYGSQVHMAMRILKPKFGGGLDGIPIVVMAQPSRADEDAAALDVEATGTATADAVHTLVVCGRDNVDGIPYTFQVNTGDTPTIIAGKMVDAINNVLGCPFTAAENLPAVTCTAKFTGEVTNDLSIYVETNGNAAGLTYSVSVSQAGTGTNVTNIQESITFNEDEWNTLYVNCYGLNEQVADFLETYNGFPSNDNPTGRYEPTVHKPFIAVTGYTEDVTVGTQGRTDLETFVGNRNNLNTIALAPAPLSDATGWEAAANMVTVYAPIANNTPHLDAIHKLYPDMPAATEIKDMSKYDQRDALVKLGISTVTLQDGVYKVEDFVTTYNLTTDGLPQHRWVRNRTVDANVKYNVVLLKETFLVGKTIVGDDDPVIVDGAVKPKEWRAQMFTLMQELGNLALIADVPFAQNSIQVALGTSNPDRLETKFDYKRSGIYRILPTTATAGFNFGTL